MDNKWNPEIYSISRKCVQKLINPKSQEYLNAKHNLKVYNGILNKNIRLSKRGCYAQQFEKYRC